MNIKKQREREGVAQKNKLNIILHFYFAHN